MYDPVITTSFDTTGKLEFRGKQCPADMVHVLTVTLGKPFILSRLENQLGKLRDSNSLLKISQFSLMNTYQAPTTFKTLHSVLEI